MARPGGVKTMQDEIDAGLRDKSGRPFTAEELAKNAQGAEKEVAQPAPETTPTEDGAEDQGNTASEPQGSDNGSEQADAEPKEE